MLFLSPYDPVTIHSLSLSASLRQHRTFCTLSVLVLLLSSVLHHLSISASDLRYRYINIPTLVVSRAARVVQNDTSIYMPGDESTIDHILKLSPFALAMFE